MEEKPQILITGFNAFKGVDVNPTESIINSIARSNAYKNSNIKTVVLETSYLKCEEQFEKCFKFFDPDGIISFGVNPRINKIRLERFAINLDDTGKPDNMGITREGLLIDKAGPAAYWTTLPIENIFNALNDAKVPVEFSNHAGTFVCNHLLYYGLALIDKLKKDTIMGFVHVPPISKVFTNGSKENYFTLNALTKYCEIVIQKVEENILKRKLNLENNKL